jgi:hypothetical protein
MSKEVMKSRRTASSRSSVARAIEYEKFINGSLITKEEAEELRAGLSRESQSASSPVRGTETS